MAQVFREKSLDRISSAEDLHSYMRVTSPRLWMVLATVLVLVVGFIVFASLITMEDTIKTTADVDIYGPPEFLESHNGIDVVVPESIVSTVQIGTEVRVGDREGVIIGFSQDILNGTLAQVQLENSDLLMDKGSYDAEIILERVSPISFLLN